MPKKILFVIPSTLLEAVDGLAQKRGMNRSDLVREACRLYIETKEREYAETEMKHATAQQILHSLKENKQ